MTKARRKEIFLEFQKIVDETVPIVIRNSAGLSRDECASRWEGQVERHAWLELKRSALQALEWANASGAAQRRASRSARVLRSCLPQWPQLHLGSRMEPWGGEWPAYRA